jgi:P27 family predicted phage terminase small subunit
VGRRGPPPKPTKLKVAAGNPGKRPLNQREPDPEVAAPPMPGWLSDRAKVEWKRITPELVTLGIVSRIDQAALAAYCQAVAELEQATRTIDAEGRVCVWPILDKDGDKIGERLKSHPAVQQQRDAMQRVKGFLAEFGLSPASRSRVQAAGADKPPPAKVVTRPPTKLDLAGRPKGKR